MRKNRGCWTKIQDTRVAELWAKKKDVNWVAHRMEFHPNTVRGNLRRLGLLVVELPRWTPELCNKPGLPTGHLAPWPDDAPMFEDDPRAVHASGYIARFMRPEPTTSSGVVHYGGGL